MNYSKRRLGFKDDSSFASLSPVSLRITGFALLLDRLLASIALVSTSFGELFRFQFFFQPISLAWSQCISQT